MSNTISELPESPRVLIILTGALGDVARGMCLVGQIKNARPQAVVSWLVSSKWAELVRKHPLVDEVVVFERERGVKGVYDVSRQLSKHSFDLALDLQRIFKSGLFSILSRAPRRIGFHSKDTKEMNWLFNNEHIPQQGDRLPKVEHYLEFLVQLGISPLRELDFGLGGLDLGQELPHVEPLLSDPAVAVVLGSSWESKEWPFEHYLELISALVHDRGVQVVLVDAPAKEAMARAITERVGEEKVLNLVGQTTLSQMAALLKSVHAVIGPDCGAGHVAAAVKTPYISLFGPTSPVRTAPYGNERLVLQADMECIPCYKRSCPLGQNACMARISPGDVLTALDRVLVNQQGSV